MDRDRVRGIVLPGALPAAFESACLIRCADVGRPLGALAEFDQKDAAVRLSALLTDLGFAAAREVRTGGGRRQYHLERVSVLEPQRPAADRTMAAGWHQGRLVLLHAEALGASALRAQRRTALAHAAWRAALLAGGRRRRAGQLCVRLRDHEMAAMLVRAARLIGVAAAVTNRPGCLAVTVDAATGPRLTTVPG
jgi:hypothetical protein